MPGKPRRTAVSSLSIPMGGQSLGLTVPNEPASGLASQRHDKDRPGTVKKEDLVVARCRPGAPGPIFTFRRGGNCLKQVRKRTEKETEEKKGRGWEMTPQIRRSLGPRQEATC